MIKIFTKKTLNVNQIDIFENLNMVLLPLQLKHTV